MLTPRIIEMIRNKIKAELSSASFIKKLGIYQWFANRKNTVRIPKDLALAHNLLVRQEEHT